LNATDGQRIRIAGEQGQHVWQCVPGRRVFSVAAGNRQASLLKVVFELTLRHIDIPAERGNTNRELRVLAVPAGEETVLVASGLAGVEDSIRILRDAALIGCPLVLLAMGMATYFIVGRALRPVAALRKGAQEITAADLADQRLPVPDAHDEIYRLAVTLNAMLDRIDAATKRQRTFVGDAAHELRSPLGRARDECSLLLGRCQFQRY
jgi:signal transduction histidine kinase